MFGDLNTTATLVLVHIKDINLTDYFESECEQQTIYILFTGAFYFNKLHVHTRRQLHVKYIKKNF